MYSVVNLRGRERTILSWCKGLWGVETGTKAVISANFSAYGERTVNNLRANFSYWNTLKRVFQQPRLLTPTIQPKQQSREPHRAFGRPCRPMTAKQKVAAWQQQLGFLAA
jgi:hypothetical protein